MKKKIKEIRQIYTETETQPPIQEKKARGEFERVRVALYTFLGEGVGTPTRHDGRLMRRQLVSRPGRTGVPAARPPPPKTSPRRPLEEDGDRRTTSTCRWSRREVPTCRSPLVAARSRRVSWAGYQERGGARPSFGVATLAGRLAWTAASRGASPRASRRFTRNAYVDAGWRSREDGVGWPRVD